MHRDTGTGTNTDTDKYADRKRDTQIDYASCDIFPGVLSLKRLFLFSYFLRYNELKYLIVRFEFTTKNSI